VKLDTGSEKNYMGWLHFCELGHTYGMLVAYQTRDPVAVGGSEHLLIGTHKMQFVLKDDPAVIVTAEFEVLDDTYTDDILVGRATINSYGLLSRRRAVIHKAFPTGSGRGKSKCRLSSSRLGQICMLIMQMTILRLILERHQRYGIPPRSVLYCQHH
jgi:hypothetical protein